MRLGKRNKGKNNSDITLIDLYVPFIKSDPFSITLTKKLDPERVQVSRKEFIAMTKLYYKRIMEKIIEEGKVYSLPYSLGNIKVEKKKMLMNCLTDTNTFKVDWHKSRELGYKVYHLNEHRDYNRYKIRWEKRGRIKGQGAYKFVPTRKWKRRLAHILKNNPKMDYFE